MHCSLAGLQCVYGLPDPVALSRRSIVRGKVIERCKETLTYDASGKRKGPAPSTTQARLPLEKSSERLVSPFTAEFFLDLVEDYCKYTLLTIPVISEAEFRLIINSLTDSTEDLSLVTSLAAQTLNLTHTLINRVPLTDDMQALFSK